MILAVFQTGVFVILGLVFGSFASLLSHRLPRDLPVGMTRSACPSCGRNIAARDLVPLLGFLLQRGKCRWCGKPISLRYPVMEIICALLFLAAFLMSGMTVQAGILSAMSFTLLVIVASDLETFIIPDEMVILLAVLGILWRHLVMPGWGQALAGAMLGAGLTLGLRALFILLRRKQGLGLGDVKFIAAAGIWIGVAGLSWLLIIGGCLGVVFGLLWQAKMGKKYFPFGPSLAVALYAIILLQMKGFPV